MKDNKGVTLVSLVITIIVLLILSTVTIGILTGDNGIINKANRAKEQSEIAEVKERIMVDIREAEGESETGELTTTQLSTILNQYFSDVPVSLPNNISESNLELTTKTGGYKIRLADLYSDTVSEGTVVEQSTTKTVMEYARGAMPSGATILEGTNKQTGIVMIDSNDNQWVWVEVPASVFTTAQNSTDYNNIKADLIAYATDYREGKTGQRRYWIDEWSAKDGDSYISASTTGLTDEQKLLNNGCGLNYSDYNTAYQNMLSSIYTNKGFYISRYEIGDKESTQNNTTRTDSTGASNTPVSKVDQIPYNYVTCSQAQGLANSMKTGSKNGSLLFGIQWDLVCKFLEVNANWPSGQTAKYYLKDDSTSWGNYKNQSLTLNRGKYNTNPSSSSSIWTAYNVDTTNYVTSSQTSDNTSYCQLLTTGASEATKKMNIYDFAGNLLEWTLEHGISHQSWGRFLANMGGSFDCDSSISGAYRNDRLFGFQLGSWWFSFLTLLVDSIPMSMGTEIFDNFVKGN